MMKVHRIKSHAVHSPCVSCWDQDLMPRKCLKSPLTLQHYQSAYTIRQRLTANYGYFVTPLVSPRDSLLLGWDLSESLPARVHMEWE